MQLKTFIAKDMRAALESVRAEMGEDAVIVASERARGGGVLVRAARDDQEPANDPEALDDRPSVAADHPAPGQIATFERSYRDILLRRVRGEASERRGPPRTFDRAELLAILRKHRAREQLAHELAQSAEGTGLSDMTLALASALDKRMAATPLDLARASALLLMGPPGCGKSAIAAKIAAHARLVDRRVLLIAADATGAGAVARLETFANHLGAGFVVSESAQALSEHVQTALGEGTLAVIDTAGFDPRHAKARTAFAALARLEGVEALGVLAASQDAEEAAEIAGALATLGMSRVIVTGLDLTRRMGALLAAASEAPKFAHVTRSPFVAGGLETLTPLSLARLLIETEGGSADGMSAQ